MFDFFDQEVLGIIGLTLRMTLTSTAISAVLGIPFGLWLAKTKPNFRATKFLKNLIVSINRTLMGTPPVVVGLVVFLILMRNGPLGSLGWLFTFQAMVIAQVILITPIISGIVYTAANRSIDRIQSFAATMGASKFQTNVLLIRELGNEIFFAVITGFGRAMSEVGAIAIVGGNIRNLTRVMTTTIALDINRGFRDQAILFGIILMIIAFAVQITADLLRKRERRQDENF
ncbi:MAG: ABC transporter permease [Defluviitaleaceae bacterium]|nr:ABC transporter permease [Defluviitaleaceae bacterium]